jgi:hypothetical protein
MSDEQRKNLLVRNKADHFPYYAYAGDGWIDGRDVTSDGRSWETTDGYDFSCELTPGTYVLTAECDATDKELNEGIHITNARGTYYEKYFPAGAGAAQPTTFTVTEETAGTWFVTGKRRGARWRAALFSGDTPAAWAPYSGEEIAGGGCSHER